MKQAASLLHWLTGITSLAVAAIMASVMIIARAPAPHAETAQKEITMAPAPLSARVPVNTAAWQAKPLFNPRRSDAPETTVQAQPAVPATPAPELVGLLRNRGGASFALIKSANSPSQKLLRIGQEHDGWRLAGVTRRSAILTRGAERVELKLLLDQKAPMASLGGPDPIFVQPPTPDTPSSSQRPNQ
jgi:hypothetical protein